MGNYTIPGRLQDVLALIQVLALDVHAHRSEAGMIEELQGIPSSSKTWTGLALEHPEFFRVSLEGDHLLSLVARHVIPRDEKGLRNMPPDFTFRLLQTAIDLHDRQVNAAERWKAFLPLWAALIGGAFGTISTLLTLWFAKLK